MAAAQFTIDRLYTKDLYVNGAQITHPSLAALLTDHPSNNVGIGTNDPKVKLDINGTDALRLPAGNRISAASGGDRPADADANYCIRYNTDDNIFEGYSNGNWGSLGGVTSINQKVTITADNTDGLKFLTGPDGGSSLERMHILNDGTVNIGSITNVESVINSKAATTYVDNQIAGLVDSAPGALDTLNELAAALGDDANYAATVTNSLALKAPLASPSFTGNVTIGTQLLGPHSGYMYIKSGSNLYFNTNNSNAASSATTKMTILGSNGNVGIGTTSPGEKLEVAGDISCNGIRILSGADTKNTYIRNSDNPSGTHSMNVAIGFDAMKIHGTGSYNTAVGAEAMKSSTEGSNNTAFGAEALENTTSGWNNVAVGGAALRNTSSGRNNVGVGYAAGSNNKTGEYNVAIGYSSGPKYDAADAYGDLDNTICIGYGANSEESNTCIIGNSSIKVGIGTSTPGEKLEVNGNIKLASNGKIIINSDTPNIIIQGSSGTAANMTGTNNIIMGETAGYDITSGEFNNIFGYKAGHKITTGTYNNIMGGEAAGAGVMTGNGMNNIFGRMAGYKITSGTNNNILGNMAGYELTTGTHNNIFGYQSGNKFTTGHYNNIMGYRAGHNGVMTGSGYNNFFGYEAGYNVTSGQHGIFLGYRAGYNIASGNNNIAIGKNSGATADKSNTICIGEWATVTGDNMCRIGNDDIKVGIGTSSPEAALHVDGNVTKYISGGRRIWSGATSVVTFTANNYSISIYASHDIRTAGNIFVSSDIRIKENIVDVSDNKALNMLRQIPCRYYEYKDKFTKGNEKTIGFIAQEVKEVLPVAVATHPAIIPNELRLLENISWNGNKMSSTDLQDVSGIKYRFYVGNDISDNEKIVDLVGDRDNCFTFEQEWEIVYCYGKEVDDFHALDKQKLFALNFSATQEIDRIQQAEKAKLAAAETEITTLKDKVTSLETTITDLVARLTALETA